MPAFFGFCQVDRGPFHGSGTSLLTSKNGGIVQSKLFVNSSISLGFSGAKLLKMVQFTKLTHGFGIDLKCLAADHLLHLFFVRMVSESLNPRMRCFCCWKLLRCIVPNENKSWGRQVHMSSRQLDQSTPLFVDRWVFSKLYVLVFFRCLDLDMLFKLWPYVSFGCSDFKLFFSDSPSYISNHTSSDDYTQVSMPRFSRVRNSPP